MSNNQNQGANRAVHDSECKQGKCARPTVGYWGKCGLHEQISPVVVNQGASEAERVIEAVRKLVKAKGRFHTEQNYKALAGALDSYDAARRTPAATTGELPPPAIRTGNCFPNFADAADQPYYTAEQVQAAIEADRAQRQAAPASAQPADPVSVFRQHVGMISTDDAAGPYLKVRFRTMAEADTAFDFVSRGLSAGAQPDQRESAAVPDGWKLVPVEPTAEMLVAGAESEDKDFGFVIHKCYVAMLAASPAAQPVAKDEQKGDA